MKGNEMKLGVVLLAAGKSIRFGANKLLCDAGGVPMVCRALAAMRGIPAEKRVAVAGCAEVARLAQACGAEIVMNDAPELGQAHSIRLGVNAVRTLDAALLLVADQPLLTAASLDALLRAFCRSGSGIACLRDETHAGNPAVFARRYFDELLGLTGDRGAKGVLKRHADDLEIVPCLRPFELSDADDPRALGALLKGGRL